MSGTYEAGYSYDVNGNRRYSNIGGSVKKYVLDVNTPLPKVLMETDNNGNVLNYYVYGLELISRIKSDNSITYYHSDYRGSIVAMSNSSQIITHKYKYGTFGELLSKYESDPNQFRFIGSHGVMDEGNGLYFMRARYYDPKLRRFITEDPKWRTNLYQYSSNNPIMWIDPDGRIEQLAEITKIRNKSSNLVRSEVKKLENKYNSLKEDATASIPNLIRLVLPHNQLPYNQFISNEILKIGIKLGIKLGVKKEEDKLIGNVNKNIETFKSYTSQHQRDIDEALLGIEGKVP